MVISFSVDGIEMLIISACHDRLICQIDRFYDISNISALLIVGILDANAPFAANTVSRLVNRPDIAAAADDEGLPTGIFQFLCDNLGRKTFGYCTDIQ